MSDQNQPQEPMSARDLANRIVALCITKTELVHKTIAREIEAIRSADQQTIARLAEDCRMVTESRAAERKRAEAAEAQVKVLRDALQVAKRYIRNLESSIEDARELGLTCYICGSEDAHAAIAGALTLEEAVDASKALAATEGKDGTK